MTATQESLIVREQPMPNDISKWSDDKLAKAFSETGEQWLLNQLYTRHNSSLKRIATQMLQKTIHANRDNDLSEQLVDDTWMRLWRKPKTLARFDPHKGSLLIFLTLLLQDAVRQYVRSFRPSRNQCASTGSLRCPNRPDEIDAETATYMHDFAATLTRAEKRWWKEVVMQEAPPARLKRLSSANIEKLRQRVRKRFEAYFRTYES